MPWPMVHFTVVKNVPIWEASPFMMLGSIAPDAIHVRENITRKDKGVTHFINDDETFPSIENLIMKCMYYLDRYDEIEWKEYILGYFTHIYSIKDGPKLCTMYSR